MTECTATHVFHEAYGDLTDQQLRCYKRYNISTSDHDSLTDHFGEHAHVLIRMEVLRQVGDFGDFSFLRLPSSWV